MTPRQIWFRKRVDDCLQKLSELKKEDDWEKFRLETHEVAIELLYATNEWEKYYRENNK